MTKQLLLILSITMAQTVFCQEKHDSLSQNSQLAPLTVKKIMRDPKWMGTSPSDPFWSPDSKTLYFKWNPEKAISDSLYAVTLDNHRPYKVKPEERYMAEAQRKGSWNRNHTQLTFKKGHALYLLDIKSGQLTKILQTTAHISNPRFALKGKAVAYRKEQNLFLYKLKSGGSIQLTNFVKGKKPSEKSLDKHASFLAKDALQNSNVLQRRHDKKKAREREEENRNSDRLSPIYIGRSSISDLSLSPNGRYVIYRLANQPKIKHTIVPNYVTASGYTEDINGRPVVGIAPTDYHSYIYDRQTQEQQEIDIKQIQGIRDIPAFIKNNYPEHYKELQNENPLRGVKIFSPRWNKKGDKAVVVIRSQDNKDRWIMRFQAKTCDLQLLDRQHDEAWVAGPGIGYFDQAGQLGWLDEKTIYYRSEKTGYSHLYSQNVSSGKTTPLTSGDYEIQEAVLLPDKKQFLITSNKVEPGQSQVYRLNIHSKKQTRLTPKEGGYKATVSPNGQEIAERYSTAVHPWELYLQRNAPKTKPKQITHKAESEQYESYPWQKPEIISFKDRDNKTVYAQVYKPKHQAASKPGVIFVHGAGYLQDVLKYWGYYFREHMFMNLLANRGYTVMNIDYRGSAGYGRDWRTAIYRHMGKTIWPTLSMVPSIWQRT